MAGFTLRALGDFIDDMEDLADIPEDVADEILNAQADIVLQEQKSIGSAMGVHRAGVTLDSLKKTHVGHFSNGNAAIKVEFNGKNEDGNRNAEVAFVNEYGKTNQPARPFVQTANEKSDGATMFAAWKVYDNYLKSKKL